MTETILFEATDGVGHLVLNRPERLNGITNRMLSEVHDCLEALAERKDVRVLVLTGAGRGFCPGADLKPQRVQRGGRRAVRMRAGS